MDEDTFWLVDRQTGEGPIVDRGTAARVAGVEIDAILWAIETHGWFENGRWRVSKMN